MGFSLVQNNAAPTSLSVAFSSSNTAGNFLACFVWENAAGTFSVSDTQGNAWSAASTVKTVGSDSFQLWYAPNCKAGANTVSTTGGVAGNTIITVAEFSGVKVTSPLDAATAGASGVTTPSLTTTQTGDLLIAYVANNFGGITYTQGAGYNLIANSTGVMCWAFSTAGAAGAYNTTFTGSSGAGNTCALAAFFAAPSSGGVSTTLTGASTPVVVTNSGGYVLPITSPTLGSKIGQPTPICFTDANGNELTVTGSTKGAFQKAPIPVVLCNSTGDPLIAPFVFTSNGNAITVSATLTGTKLGQPTPVVACDFNGFLYNLSGFTLGSLAGNPTPIALTDVNGNILTLSGVTT
jgi:hypothetical protein